MLPKRSYAVAFWPKAIPATWSLTWFHWKLSRAAGPTANAFELAVTEPSLIVRCRPDSALYPVASTAATPALKWVALWNAVMAEQAEVPPLPQPLLESPMSLERLAPLL